MANARVKLKPFAAGLMLITFLSLIAPTEAFFRHLCHGEVGSGRVDPIMSPGKPSQHLHVAFGASSKSLTPFSNLSAN
jgi:hypothetical protein